MAIKGKSKPKSGAKSVTRGPRPAYVPVRKPIMQRRAFWFTVIGVVVLASALGIWYGLAKQRTADREEALARALRKAATEYQQQVDPIVTSIGTPAPPSGVTLFPEFQTAVSSLAGRQIEPEQIGEIAKSTAEAAQGAAEDLDAIQAVELVGGKGFQRLVVLYAINSESRMVQGLLLYQQAALLAQDASISTGNRAVELATRANEVLGIAKRVFSDGYQDYVEFQFQAGTYQPTLPTGLTGAAGFTGATGLTGAPGTTGPTGATAAP